MPSLEVAWVLIAFVPSVIAGQPDTRVAMGAGAVFAVEARCEAEAADRRRIVTEKLAGPAAAAVTIRCMPYWIDYRGLPAKHKGD